MYKGRSVRITPNFAMETVKVRRTWIDMLQTFHRWQSRSPYSAKFSITVDGEKWIFHDEFKLKYIYPQN